MGFSNVHDVTDASGVSDGINEFDDCYVHETTLMTVMFVMSTMVLTTTMTALLDCDACVHGGLNSSENLLATKKKRIFPLQVCNFVFKLGSGSDLKFRIFADPHWRH